MFALFQFILCQNDAFMLEKIWQNLTEICEFMQFPVKKMQQLQFSTNFRFSGPSYVNNSNETAVT